MCRNPILAATAFATTAWAVVLAAPGFADAKSHKDAPAGVTAARASSPSII